MKIYRPLEDFQGQHLIVGCGKNKKHYSTFVDTKPLSSIELHPGDNFYHVDMSTDYNSEASDADLEGDFLAPETLAYLQAHTEKFSTIFFETVTEIFADLEKSKKALEAVKGLLTEEGYCVISGVRGLEAAELVKKNFSHYLIAVYGYLQDTWSIIVANKPITIKNLLAQHPCYWHLLQTIRRRNNLHISYTVEFNRIIFHKDNAADMRELFHFNPFLVENSLNSIDISMLNASFNCQPT